MASAVTTPAPAQPPTSPRRSRARGRSSRLADVLLIAAGLAVALACLGYFGVRYLVWPRLDQWRPQLLAHASQLAGRPIEADALRPGWDGLHPTLEIQQLRVGDAQGRIRLQADALLVRPSWRSLLHGTPRLAAAHLQSPRIEVERLPSGRILFAGFLLPDDHEINEPLLDWVMSQGELKVRDARFLLSDRMGETGEPVPRVLDRVDVEVTNRGRHHEGRLSIPVSHVEGEGLRGSVSFDRPPLSRTVEWQRWQGELELAVNRLAVQPLADALVALTPRLKAQRASASGVLDQALHVRFQEGRLREGTLSVAIDSPALAWQARRVPWQRVQAKVGLLALEQDGLQVSIKEATLVDAGGVSVPLKGEARLAGGVAGSLEVLRLDVSAIAADELLAAARRLPLPASLLTSLNALQVSGRLRELKLAWHPGANVPPDVPVAGLAIPAVPIELSGSFEHLSIRHPGRAGGPVGVTNLSGTLRASGGQGELTLSGSPSGQIIAPVFAEPELAFDRLDGQLNWTFERSRKGPGSLKVTVPRLEFSNADGAGWVKGSWQSTATGPGVIDLTGRLDRISAPRVVRYLPQAIPENVRHWTEAAIVKGQAEEVDIRVQGALSDFPFQDSARGVFRIAGKVRDTTLAYAPDWPRIDQIRGELEFAGAGMRVHAHSGSIGRVRLTDITARIPEFRGALLTVDGRGQGPAQEMIGFIDDSPLAASISTYTRDVRVSGDARLALALSLPLARMSASRVRGSVDFDGNELVLDRTLPPFSDVTGRLEFTEAGIELPAMSANLLGGPIRVEGRASGEGQLRIDARGTIAADGMRRLIDNPITRALEGRTDYHARVDVDRRASSLVLESTLQGLSSALPVPFAKRADAVWPLRVVSTPLPPPYPGERPPGDRLDVRLGSDIGFKLERERDARTERLLIRRAGFGLGDEPPLRDSGFAVLLRTPRLDFDAWRALLGDGDIERMQREAGDLTLPGMSLVPDLVSIVADDLRIGGRDLHEVALGASRLEGRWRANIAAREIVGHFDWRDARPGEHIGTLSARFNRLVLARSREEELEDALSAPPTRLPGLDITADELVLGTVPIGALKLVAHSEGTQAQPVWRLSQLELDNPDARLDARGVWSFPRQGAADAAASRGARSTELDLKLAIRDAGALLDRFGIHGAVKGASGSFNGRIGWQGSPMALDLPSLQGDLQLNLGQGAFLRVDPGPARLIAVLNMQALPRLLSGELRTVFGEGFAFNSITGGVHIEAGLASTTNLLMRGPQAVVKLGGVADLRRETQDLHVEVVPELDASLASIAVGAMVNPVIGLGSLAAQYVLRKPLQEALAYEVDITGSWSDPDVQPRARRPVAPPAGQP